MIDTQEKLSTLLPAIRQSQWVAIDTEADSLHAYPEKLCLIQLSIPGEELLIDSLVDLDFSGLLAALDEHELILHGADYDLRLFRRRFNWLPRRIFDTLSASRLLGAREFGLGHLVSHYLGVTLEKGPQKADWARRPLTPRMEEYAKNDTRYLNPIREILHKELEAKGRLAWHEEICQRLIQDAADARPVDPNVVWRVKGSHLLGPGALAVLREIWHWREQEAVRANTPPFFILSPETMVKASAAADEGRPVEPLLPRRFSPRRKDTLAQAIQRGMAETDKPQRLRTVHYRATEGEKRRYLELEKKRDAQAARLGLDPTFLASRGTLVQLAQNGNDHEQIGRWQRELLLENHASTNAPSLPAPAIERGHGESLSP